MGASFVPALLEFTDPNQTRVNQIMAELEQQFPAFEDDVRSDYYLSLIHI